MLQQFFKINFLPQSCSEGSPSGDAIEAMGRQAVMLARGVDYHCAGTVEMMVDKDRYAAPRPQPPHRNRGSPHVYGQPLTENWIVQNAISLFFIV